MASEQQPLTVAYSTTALEELHEIWRWNAGRYSPTHADAYISFLQSRIARLTREFDRGRLVPGRKDLRYITILRRPKSHGHVAVYAAHGQEILILHVFHTAQNWGSKLGDEDR